MEELDGFNSLDPLGPEYGKINQPLIDEKGFSAFEGDKIQMPKANLSEPSFYYPSIPGIGNLNRPNRPIVNNHVKTNAVNPSIPQKPINAAEYKASNMQKLDAFFQSNQDKNNYAKIYSYNAGPDGNAFYKRYAAYGQAKFDEVGFSPLRNNEANFNARTTRWDDFSRMMTHSFVPLFTRGFVSGPKSLAKMLKGDFTSADLEDARVYEEAAAMGQSNKGGIFGFANNAMMNFGYTAGIITEAIAEEAAGALLAAPTGGSSLIASTANTLLKIPKLFKGLNAFKTGKRGYQAVRDTLKLTDKMDDARKFWQGAKDTALGNFATKAGQALNPLENTVDAVKRIRQADNITDLAILSKTAGGFYRDVRKINMALSEARLEAGMVENHVYDKLYNEAYLANNNEVPNNKELAEIEKQAKDASLETLLENTALIYVSNGITFHNITGPRGGIRNFIKSTTDDIYSIASREGEKNFGKIGKVIYDRTAKKFALEKNNIKNLAKGWLKNPVYKSVGNTVGYFKANFTEGIQENLQETIAEANEKYFIDSYKSPTLQTMLYSRAAMRAINRDKLDYFSDSWKTQNPFTAKGAETFASGFFMGTLAGPLNSAVPFLSSTYNKMFNKEQYANWKEAQTTVAQNLVSQLNDMDLGTFMSEEMQNLGAQDLVGTLRARENKKAGLDSEVESYISQVQKLKNTGTFGIFKEKLEGLKDATDEEFADAVNIDLEQVPKYRTRIDKSVARLNKIKDLYERVERKFPNPISNINDLDKNDPDYEEKKLLGNAWNLATRNMVFFNETYDDILKRRSEIDAKFSANPKFQKIDNKQRNLLFNPLVPEGQFSRDSGDMVEEIDILKKELTLEKELGKNSNKIRGLEEKIKITTDYVEKFKNFDLFFNRSGYIEKYAEEIKKATGKDATSEEIMEYMDSDLGGSLDENNPTGQKIISELRESYKNYLKTLGKQKGEDIFSEDLDLTFEALMDYYKLGHEKVNIAKYVELFNDSDAFLDIVRRNTDWMRVQNGRRVKYFEDLIRSEMDKVRANALLNALADKGLYMSLEDMENYMNNGIPPKEIFNNITKEIYRIGNEKYAEVYQEYFQKNDDLKSDMNPKKTGIIDDAYQKQIDDLEAKQQEEIDKLEKKPTRRETGEIKSKDRNKTFSATEATSQLAINEYVELKINKDSEAIVLFKDAEGNIHMYDVDGELVDVRDIKDRFLEGKKYVVEMLPDPLEVERITNIYNAKIEDVFKAYAADKDSVDLEIPYEEVTQESNLNTPDLIDFRNALYVAYQEEHVVNLPAEQQEALLEDSDLDQETFEKWYSLPENKKYFDEYNDENRPAVSEKETVLTVNGTTVDTKNRTLEQLFDIRNTLADKLTAENEEIEFLDTETEKEEIKEAKKRRDALALDLKNLNVIIAARQFAKYPEEIKDSVRSIQKLFKAQEKVEKVVLTEDDEVTGLKKGQTAYRVNGKIHRRMTQAMHDVIDEKYEYKGQEDVDTVFNQTIGKNGLNPASAKEFVDRLRILAEDDKKLPGTNKLFFDKLQDELLLLPARTPEQIKLENQKSEILTKAGKETDDTKKQALYEQAVEIQNKIDGTTTAPTSDIKEKRKEVRTAIQKAGQGEGGQFFVTLSDGTRESAVRISLVGDELGIGNKGESVDLGIIDKVENPDGTVLYDVNTPITPTVTDTKADIEQFNIAKRGSLRRIENSNDPQTIASEINKLQLALKYTKDFKLTSEEQIFINKKLKELEDKGYTFKTKKGEILREGEKVRVDDNLVLLKVNDITEIEKVLIEKELNQRKSLKQELIANGYSEEEATIEAGLSLEETIDIVSKDIEVAVLKNGVQEKSGKVSISIITIKDAELAALGTDTTVNAEYYESPYGTIAANYLFTGGKGVILSTDYLLQALTAVFPYSGKAIDNIRNKYANELSQILKDDINTDIYNSVMQEIRDAINNTYGNEKANKIFEKILKNATGFTLSREGNQVDSDAEKLNEELETKINTKSTQPITETTVEDNFDIATKKNGIKDITDVFFAEKSYQDGRDAGDFFDLAKDYLESGKKPEFNEKIITRQAYDDLIAYLDTIKQKVDSGELYIVGRDLVVFDSDIDLGNERRDRIAGEIDLILVDKEGIYVLDIKSGEASKFLNFNNLSRKQKIFSKRNEYTLQTAGYATMLERMIDRKIAGVAMLPIQRRSNKETNQVIEVKKPINPDLYEELNYKRDADGKLILSTEIDPKTGKPFNEKQFEITKKKYKYDFLAPLYRESVQEEIDKLFGKKEGKLAPGAKRTLSRRYTLFRDILNQISDEESKENIDKIRRAEKLINDAVKKDGITIPDDIVNLLAQKKQALRAYTGKEVIKSIIKDYKKDLSDTEKKLKDQKEELEKITSDISFDDIDKSILEDGSDFIEEQYGKDEDFAFYYDKHDDFKEEDSKDAAENQKLAILTMKTSRLLTDQDIEDDLIDELTMADASELIHEGVKRIQYLKTETTDDAAKKFKNYQSKVFYLATAMKNNANNLNILETLESAELNAEQGLMDVAYEQISRKIQNLENELNRKYTKEIRKKDINKELVKFNNFKEALALAYEIPFDAFENVVEGEVIVDEYDNEIKKGDKVYSRFSFDDTVYTVKEVTSKNIVLKDEKGKEIKVEIGKFDEQYITESEMNAGETTPPGYNPTEGEKSIIEQSQMSVDDFLRNADEDKAKAHQEGVSNTPAQNRKNLLDKTKDCQ